MRNKSVKKSEVSSEGATYSTTVKGVMIVMVDGELTLQVRGLNVMKVSKILEEWEMTEMYSQEIRDALGRDPEVLVQILREPMGAEVMVKDCDGEVYAWAHREHDDEEATKGMRGYTMRALLMRAHLMALRGDVETMMRMLTIMDMKNGKEVEYEEVSGDDDGID